MEKALSPGNANLGTAPVFLTAISTILGAILFLRFGYAVAHVGFVGTLFIILMGHLVTIPTAMAIAEIATNQKVEGGGEYYILSRSFGIIVGASIGISLFLSQAISIAFYVIAFAESFDPLFRFLRDSHGVFLSDKRIVSVPALLILTGLVLSRGVNLGVKILYLVVGTLFASLASFFLGSSEHSSVDFHRMTATVENPDPLFRVFSICFPAFTGMTAGVGLSGDLRDPKRSIPLGTLAATLTGLAVYILVALKLSASASPQELASDQLIMSRIALWGPIIPVGLACATISSALGSFLVAPRTLQALATDAIFPLPHVNSWLARGKGATGEPFNASLISAGIAGLFVLAGNVDFVAQIISMFFMLTYGSICLVSFFQHFAADPSYRPAFRSRWYLSLFGATFCVWLMFQMSSIYAALAILVMLLLYMAISKYNEDKRGLSVMFQGALFQVSRKLQVFVQKTRKEDRENWRPSVVCISSSSFERLAAFNLLRWISHRYGFGTYIHYTKGYLSKASHLEAKETLQRLVRMANVSDSNVYVDTIISPSYTTAICQVIQVPGISGKENNMILFEFPKNNPAELASIVDNYQLVASMGFDVCILASSERGFGYRREIHIWLTPADYGNAGLMILVGYMLLGHPDWKRAVIKIFSILPEERLEKEEQELLDVIRSGRLPISAKNIQPIPYETGKDKKAVVNEHSRDADLVMVGLVGEALRHGKADLFEGYDRVGNILFVNAKSQIELVDREGGGEP